MGKYPNPLVRRGRLNTLIVRLDERNKTLDFLSFKDTENGVVYADTSGYEIPLDRITVESEGRNFMLKTINKSELAKFMLDILGETENFYIVKDI
jgi:hypothetical protein